MISISPLHTVLASLTLLFAAQAGAAPTLLITDGILTGAKNVNVAGTMYNVTFSEGACNTLFNGCSNAEFTFHTAAEAIVAGQALLDQVFLDSPLGQFDSKSELIGGCPGSNIQCDTFIPFGVTSDGGVAGAKARNMSTIIAFYSDSVFVSSLRNWEDTTNSTTENYATFERASATVATVPEPSSSTLLAVSIIGLSALRRRRLR